MARIGGGDNLIQTGTVQRRLADHYNLKEQSPVPTLAPEIQAVCLVDDITQADRDEHQRQIIHATGGAPGAGQLPIIAITNPLASQTIVRMRWMTTSTDNTTTPMNLFAGLNYTEFLAGGATAGIVNARSTSFRPGSVRIGFTTAAGPPATTAMLAWYQQQFTAPHTTNLEGVILIPGVSFIVYALNVAVELEATIAWVETDLAR